MEPSYSLTIDLYELATVVGILVPWIAVGWGWLWLRRLHQRALLTQNEVARLRRDLEGRDRVALSLQRTLKQHLAQSAADRARALQLHRRLDNLEQQVWQVDGCRRAIGTARRGGALQPLVKRGALNPAEAHLIEAVHGPRRDRSTSPEPAATRSR